MDKLATGRRKTVILGYDQERRLRAVKYRLESEYDMRRSEADLIRHALDRFLDLVEAALSRPDDLEDLLGS